MDIVVLGGGRQGRVIAADLARALPSASIAVADVRAPRPEALPNLRPVEADCSSVEAVARLVRDFDLAVGALPARFGFGAMQGAIEARRPMVDVSFSEESPLALDAAARGAGVPLVPDAGLAPGLSHLAVGFAARDGVPDTVRILVGGVAQDRSAPYGYVVTWSLDDLLAEYTRPARVVRGGAPATVPVFDELETVAVEGVGTMEAFASDGLRTLVETLPGARDMVEKTLRWPGHVAAVRPLVDAGTLVETLRARCSAEPPRDLVALVVEVARAGRTRRLTLVDRYDPATGLTAMARTTALTTSVAAQWMAAGGVRAGGVHPLERVGRDPRAFEFFRERLGERGVRLAWAEA
jgi:saccharopine dehydrogenase-like NADP-dependent oxidoreductase